MRAIVSYFKQTCKFKANPKKRMKYWAMAKKKSSERQLKATSFCYGLY
jgi:hypothetical protein